MLTREQLVEIADICEAYLRIYNVETNQTTPLRFNDVQRDLIERSNALLLLPEQDATVKARQLGVSVGLLALCFGIIATIPGITICWVNLNESAAKVIRRKFEGIEASARQAGWPGLPAVKRDSAQLYQLENNSAIVWEEAGGGSNATSDDTGVGDTVNLAIFCEFSRWPAAHKTLVSIMPAIESARGGVFIDSTPPEHHGQGLDYLARVNGLRRGNINGTLFFWPWWERRDRRANHPARAPYDEEEVWLLNNARHLNGRIGLDLHQLQWRRTMLADPNIGPVFRYAYPEDLVRALEPKGIKAFDDDVIKVLAYRARDNTWPRHLSPEEIRSSLPDALHQTGYDPLLDPAATKVFAPPPPPQLSVTTSDRARLEALAALGSDPAASSALDRQLRRDNSELLMRRVHRRSLVDLGEYHLGVDSSDGGPLSDYQSFSCIDPEAEISVFFRGRLSPIQYASLVARVGYWFANACITVEINASSGALVYRYLVEHLSEEEVAKGNAHPCLIPPYPNAQEWRADPKTRPELETLVLSHLNGLIDVPCNELFDEMLHWDVELRKARSGSVDDGMDGLGVALVARAHRVRQRQSARLIKPTYGLAKQLKAF